MIRRQIATQRFIVAANMGPEHGTPKPWPGRPTPRTQPRDSK